MRDDDVDPRLADLLDSSFGSGPDGLPTPSERLTAGRRALRRRHRAAVAVATMAVAGALGLGAALSGVAGGADADGRQPPLATSGTDPSPDPSSSPSAPSSPIDEWSGQGLVSAENPATYDADGRLVIRDGWQVTERVDEPVGLRAPEQSVGLALSDGPRTRWVLLVMERIGPAHFGISTISHEPGRGFIRFDDWVANQPAVQGHDPAWPVLLTVGEDDVPRPLPGVQLLGVRAAPGIEGYTSSGDRPDRMVEVRREGHTWFALVRGHGPDAQVIPVDAAVLPGPTFAAFADHVRSQVASGEGLG